MKGNAIMNHDLTVGEPSVVLCRFCLPLFGSIIFQQLYNLADSWVAGRFIGENALAAVGNSYELTLIYLAFAFGCNIGCSVMVSQYFGARRLNELKSCVYTTSIATAILSMLFIAVGLCFGKPLLLMIHTPEEILEQSQCYLDIYTLGVPFVLFYNVATGIFAAMGDSRTPFVFLVISSLSNIAADVLFVFLFQNGVAGIAWATFICQGISCLAAILVVRQRLHLLPGKGRLFSWKILRDISSIAIPSILQQGAISIGNIMLQGDVNSFGPGVIAGYSASVKLNNLVITAFTTLGNGISNYTAQNLGAEKIQRIGNGFCAGLKLVWLLCIPICLFYFLRSSWLVHLFLDEPTETALHTGTIFLKLLSPFYLVIATKLVADGILRGSHRMNLFMVATFTDLFLRVGLAKAFSGIWGATGIWCAWPFGWTIAMVLSVSFYKLSMRKFYRDMGRK